MQGQDPEKNIAFNINIHSNIVKVSGKNRIVIGMNNIKIAQNSKVIIEVTINPAIEIGLPMTKQLKTEMKHSNNGDIKSNNIRQKVHTITLIKVDNKIQVATIIIKIGIRLNINGIILITSWWSRWK